MSVAMEQYTPNRSKERKCCRSGVLGGEEGSRMVIWGLLKYHGGDWLHLVVRVSLKSE